MVSLKTRKKNVEDEELQSEGEALSTLVADKQCGSSVIWPQRETIYSASWDRSVRRWDVETGKDNLSMSYGKVVNCLDIEGESSTLIAAGGSDPILRIWILEGQELCHLSFNSHHIIIGYHHANGTGNHGFTWHLHPMMEKRCSGILGPRGHCL